MMLGVVPFLSGFLVLCECGELSAYCQQIPLLLLFVKVGFCKLQSKKSWQIHLRASYLNLSHSLLLHFSNGRNDAYLTGWGMGEMRWHGNELGTVPPHMGDTKTDSYDHGECFLLSLLTSPMSWGDSIPSSSEVTFLLQR